MIDKIKNSLFAAGAFAFALFTIWDLSVPVDEQLFSQLVNLIFLIIESLIGGIAGARAYVSHKYHVRAK